MGGEGAGVNEHMAYIGRKSCGCVVAAYVDDPERRKDTAKEVASWIRDGLTVEHVTVTYANEQFKWDCPHKPIQAQMSLFDEVQP